MQLLYLIELNIILITLSSGSKILFYFPRSTYSHRITVWPLVEQLAARGHDVTFIQAYPPKKPNSKIKEFYPKSLLNAAKIDSLNLLKLRLEGGRDAIISNSLKNVINSVDACAKFLNEPETQEWIKDSNNFDLVIIDDLHNECGYGLAYKFGAKTALFVTSHPTVRRFEPLGVLLETSWIPDLRLSPQLPMSFLERVENTLEPLTEYFGRQWFYYPELDQVIREGLRLPDMPSVATLERETSLVFANTHFSEEFARSLPPMYVSVGGMHCEDSSQSLTKELEEFINKTDGFIYVSFGSAARISEAPEEFQNIFYQAMGNSKMHFVWKYEGQRNAKIPSNVFVSNWLPQQAILAHPKIKAYFTHGGLLGIQEAVWHGVPLLAMPVFAEQDYNSMRVHRTERGVMLDPNTLTLEILEEALKNVVQDRKYKDNMMKVSSKFKDRPVRAVETAVWWTEYILRHANNTDMKPLGMEQNWLVRRSLDVWAAVFSIMTETLLVALVLVRKFVSTLSLLWKSKVKVN